MIHLQSQACADVLLTTELANQVLAIWGKSLDDPAIILVEQLPELIARTQQAIATSKIEEKNHSQTSSTALEDKVDDREENDLDSQEPAHNPSESSVALAKRLVPILRLLEKSHHNQVPVTWKKL